MIQSDSVLSPVLNASAVPGGACSIDVRHAKSRIPFHPRELPALGSLEEVLVVDERSKLRPAQVVESKLSRLVTNASLPVSLLLMRGMLLIR